MDFKFIEWGFGSLLFENLLFAFTQEVEFTSNMSLKDEETENAEVPPEALSDDNLEAPAEKETAGGIFS